MIMFTVLENEFGHVYGETTAPLINLPDNCTARAFVGSLSKWRGQGALEEALVSRAHYTCFQKSTHVLCCSDGYGFNIADNGMEIAMNNIIQKVSLFFYNIDIKNILR